MKVRTPDSNCFREPPIQIVPWTLVSILMKHHQHHHRRPTPPPTQGIVLVPTLKALLLTLQTFELLLLLLVLPWIKPNRFIILMEHRHQRSTPTQEIVLVPTLEAFLLIMQTFELLLLLLLPLVLRWIKPNRFIILMQIMKLGSNIFLFLPLRCIHKDKVYGHRRTIGSEVLICVFTCVYICMHVFICINLGIYILVAPGFSLKNLNYYTKFHKRTHILTKKKLRHKYISNRCIIISSSMRVTS